ncbi:MAG: hypothetical protein P4L84_19870 [Isosphaeraceae bacterium]|nr:hypothetical protein [Isosphaeraceae bacterium]
MVLRLWWKEWRAFWPLGAFVLVLAVVAQWLALQSDDPGWRRGGLSLLALSWTALYAFAISAAAFAGEREHGTLRWLDAIPIDRRTLWGGKASFALVSTFGLALLLGLLASFGTGERDEKVYGYAAIALGTSALFLETIAWGLFWSALVERVLLAATLAVVCVGTVAGFAVERIFFDFGSLERTAPLRFALSAVLLPASWLVLTRKPRRQRIKLNLPRPALRTLLGRLRMKRRHSARRSLAWETRREATGAWFALLLLGLAGPVLGSAWIERVAPELFVAFGVFGSLLAGVNVFHAENRARTFRFYVQHGVSPSRVWWAKTGTWLTLVLLFTLVVLGTVLRWYDVRAIALLSLVMGFAVGVLCGQVIERGITAAVVGVAVTLLLVVPYAGMAAISVLPEGAMLLPPLILLGVSWAWTGDWMLARSGRWRRLAVGLCVPFGCLLGGQLAYRAWSIPDIGRLPAPVSAEAPPHGPGRDAAEVYRNAGFAMVNGGEGAAANDAVVRVISNGWDPSAAVVVSLWEQNRRALDLVRQGAELPGGTFGAQKTLFSEPADVRTISELPLLVRLLALDAREREFRGDLDGAWLDVRAALKIAHQLADRAYATRLSVATIVELQGLHMGMAWAAAPGQSRERLHATLEELQQMPERLPLGETIKVEAATWERTLSLPTNELRPFLTTVAKPSSMGRGAFAFFSWFLVNPWERERARRAGRIYFTDALEYADREPWGHSAGHDYEGFYDLRVVVHGRPRLFTASEIAYDFRSTPVLRFFGWGIDAMMFRVNRNVVDRRALITLLAIRAWQLGHDGHPPEQLAELVPSELARLPVDPYSGHQYGYLRSNGQGVPPLGELAAGVASAAFHANSLTQPGQWLLYSVGPDRRDDRGLSSGLRVNGAGDMVYPVPEEHGEAAPPWDEPVDR